MYHENTNFKKKTDLKYRVLISFSIWKSIMQSGTTLLHIIVKLYHFTMNPYRNTFIFMINLKKKIRFIFKTSEGNVV